MYLLSIQGRYAPAFQLKNSAAGKLKHQIEATTKQPALVISSRFRSDLIYLDNTNSLVESMKVWCHLVGYHYTDALKMKFFRSDEEATSLHYFFLRLQLIKRIPGWYNGYVKEFEKVLLENPQHPLYPKLYGAMESFLQAIEKQRIKGENEVNIKRVSKFINLNNLAGSNSDNCN